MNATQKGFSLIELLVSTAVGYFLITLLIMALWVVYHRLSLVRVHNSALATLSVAHDLLRRDFTELPCDRSLLKRISNNSLIWPIPNGNDRGYEIVGTILKRTEGHYDIKYQRWHDATSSVVLQRVKYCNFAIEGTADLIDTIKVALAVDDGTTEIKTCDVIGIRNKLIG